MPLRRHNPACVIALCSLAAAFSWPAACVTERLPSRTRPGTVGSLTTPVTPDQAAALANAADKSSGAATQPARTSSSQPGRAVFTVQPVGLLPYDGQTLPIASPGARFIVTQVGDPPPWDVTLARPGATPWFGTRLKMFEVVAAASASASPGLAVPSGTLRELAPDQPLPAGLLLGRSSDARGFLVERPNPDGSRSIGRVPWPTTATASSGSGTPHFEWSVEWLLDDGACNTDAVMVGDDVLIAARRGVGGGGGLPADAGADAADRPDAGGFSLAFYARGQGEPTLRSLPGRSLRYPCVSPDRRTVMALAIDERGSAPTEVVVIRLDAPDLPIIARLPMGGGSGTEAAFQASRVLVALPFAPDQSLNPGAAGAAPSVSGTLSWFSPAEGVCVRLEPGPPSRIDREPAVLSVIALDGDRELVLSDRDVRVRTVASALPQAKDGSVRAATDSAVTVWPTPGVLQRVGASACLILHPPGSGQRGAPQPPEGVIAASLLIFGK